MAVAGMFLPGWLLRLLPVQRNNDISHASQLIRKTCQNMITAKRAKNAAAAAAAKQSPAADASTPVDEEKATGGSANGKDVDILSVALNSGAFDDEDLVNQLMTFLAAGHETTASAMTWAILALCQSPSAQSKLRAELSASNLPSPRLADGKVTSADIDSLPYLTAFCNEVLRLYPPVPITLRISAQDTTLLGHAIPKGTTVIMSPLAINRSAALWGPDALEFRPERWLAARPPAESNFANMTFLHGPRSCIAQAFAKAEFACLVAAWVAAFETELEDPGRKIEVGGGVTTRPKGGLRVKLTPVSR